MFSQGLPERNPGLEFANAVGVSEFRGLITQGYQSATLGWNLRTPSAL